MRPPRLLKAAAVPGFAATLALITAVPARAHAGGGAEPSNYRAEVTSQPAPCVAVDLGVGGQWIRVTGRTGVAVTVLGYAGEPFLRIRSGHVAVNRHSTTAADNPRLSPVPVRPDTSAAPQWVDAGSGNGIAAWSDDRLTGGSGGRSGEQGTWTLPVRVDGAETTITGTWTRVAAPSPWAWAAGLVAVAVAVCALGWLSRPGRSRARGRRGGERRAPHRRRARPPRGLGRFGVGDGAGVGHVVLATRRPRRRQRLAARRARRIRRRGRGGGARRRHRAG